MCGIAISVNASKEETLLMGAGIRHRGIHYNIDEIDNIKVCFSWLPIVSEKAPQPMTAGKWTMWLNGYISNYKELQEKYNIDLYVDSDTLLVAELFDKEHPQVVEQFNGFFSIVAYNTQNKTLFTITDRHGIKQLYQHRDGEKTFIASEPKALLRVMKNVQLDNTGVFEWLTTLGVLTKDTVFRNIKKLPSLYQTMVEPAQIDYEEAKDRLRLLLNQSFNRNKIKNNVKTGVFLSGGIDSSLIVKNIDPDFVFSMDYVDSKLSEIKRIKENSRGIHYTMVCNDDLYEKYKAPTIKAVDDLKVGSSYTNYALTELASKFCTVLYSGAGADELFYGYPHRYNKPIDDVISRSVFVRHPNTDMTHEEYDDKFLKGILIVEDRIGGHFAMETRYPFLDNDLVDFVRSLPKEYRMNKRILKDVSGLSFEFLLNYKKKGFSNPVSNDEWTKFALDETKRLYNIV